MNLVRTSPWATYSKSSDNATSNQLDSVTYRPGIDPCVPFPFRLCEMGPLLTGPIIST